MTREQAVQMIENMPISHECREFFDLALDALRQPEIVRCEDCDNYDSETGRCAKGVVHGCAETWFCADGERATTKQYPRIKYQKR